MSYFTHHVFFCCNQRAEGETCCANHDAVALQTYAKDRIGALGLNGKGQIRINKAGCLGRCDDGPVLVVYPKKPGTPSSTRTTSTRSSPSTCKTAASSNA
jgi:NADH:ubiquinone oxidoreductase subunit E